MKRTPQQQEAAITVTWLGDSVLISDIHTLLRSLRAVRSKPTPRNSKLPGGKNKKERVAIQRLPTAPTVEKIPLRTPHNHKPSVKNPDFVTAVIYKL